MVDHYQRSVHLHRSGTGGLLHNKSQLGNVSVCLLVMYSRKEGGLYYYIQGRRENCLIMEGGREEEKETERGWERERRRRGRGRGRGRGREGEREFRNHGISKVSLLHVNPGRDSPAWVEHLHFVGNYTGLGASDSAVYAVLKTSLTCWE